MLARGTLAAALVVVAARAVPALAGDLPASSLSSSTSVEATAVRRLAGRVVERHENLDRGFVVVSKRDARVYVYDRSGALRASSPVLLGAAVGDDTVPGIGDRPLAQVRPWERTTPAGRFLGEEGVNTAGDSIVWIDYDAAVSMHRVRTSNPAEHRLERLASPRVRDRRISYGCINLPAAFFEAWIAPLFAGGKAYVYVLPEVRTEAEVFGAAR